MPFIDGPYVTAACLCDMVIEDKTGALSLIRVIDTLTHPESGPNPPREMPAFMHGMYLVLMLKSGSVQGRYDVRIAAQRPDGSSQNIGTFTFYFEGEEKGQNLIANTQFQFTTEGLHWFRVYLGDDEHEELLTAIPLRVKYNRVVTAPMAPG